MTEDLINVIARFIEKCDPDQLTMKSIYSLGGTNSYLLINEDDPRTIHNYPPMILGVEYGKFHLYF